MQSVQSAEVGHAGVENAYSQNAIGVPVRRTLDTSTCPCLSIRPEPIRAASENRCICTQSLAHIGRGGTHTFTGGPAAHPPTPGNPHHPPPPRHARPRPAPAPPLPPAPGVATATPR